MASSTINIHRLLKLKLYNRERLNASPKTYKSRLFGFLTITLKVQGQEFMSVVSSLRSLLFNFIKKVIKLKRLKKLAGDEIEEFRKSKKQNTKTKVANDKPKKRKTR